MSLETIIPTKSKLYKDWITTSQGQAFIAKSPFPSKDSYSLSNMLRSIFDYYEIGAGDDDEMGNFMASTYNQWIKYYTELYNAYTTAFDLSKAALITHTMETKYGSAHSVSASDSDTDNNTDIDYDLPSGTARTEYPSYKSTTDYSHNRSSDTKDTHSGSDTITNTSERNPDFISLKIAYMKQIQDITMEFALKFKENFLLVY